MINARMTPVNIAKEGEKPIYCLININHVTMLTPTKLELLNGTHHVLNKEEHKHLYQLLKKLEV